MNFKQMVLFEELVDILSRGTMRVAFGIGPDMCLGEFRKPKTWKCKIESERLKTDYDRYVAEDATYFKEIRQDLTADAVEYAGEKFLTVIFNHVYAFLEGIRGLEDNYLKGYDDAIIYNLYKFDQYYKECSIDGVKMEPFSMVAIEE